MRSSAEEVARDCGSVRVACARAQEEGGGHVIAARGSVRVRAGCALPKSPAACTDGVRNALSRVSSRAGLKILFALPLDAGFCCSRIAGHTLGLRRPMILAGQLLATVCLVLVFFVSPVTSLPIYQLVGFLRICGAAMIVIGVEGYATDASIVVFAGHEALPSAAFQIGRNLGASIGQLAGGQLSSTRGFDAMLLLFLALSAGTMPVMLLVKELRAVPPAAAALHRNSAKAGVPPAQGAVPAARSSGGSGGGGGILATLAALVPVRLIAAWITRPSVLAFLLFNCVANVGVGLSTLYLVKFYTLTRSVDLFEVGQLQSLTNTVALVANAPVAFAIDRYVLHSHVRLRFLLAATIAALAVCAVLPLATAEGGAGKPGLFAIAAVLGVVQSLANLLYFSLLLRISDRRFSATAFSIASMITNAFLGPVPKQIAVAVLERTPGRAGIEQCMQAGAIVAACAVVASLLFVLPSIEEQARLDGDLQPADVEAPAIAQTGSEQLLAVYPTMPSAGDGAARRERVLLAQLPRP